MEQLSQLQKNYYRLLAEKYPSRDRALAEAILLESGLNLPKPTEHFVSDLHGEYRAFTHVIRNASGCCAATSTNFSRKNPKVSESDWLPFCITRKKS